MTRDLTATDAFLAEIVKAKALLATLNAYVDDHLGVEPGPCTWANVGDVERLNASLREIAEFIAPKGEK